MIRYRDNTFEQWSICPATGEIFDSKTGEVQPLKIYGDRPHFKRMCVHQIMAHTFYGFKPGYVVHHLDENKLNNSLSNLVYLTHSEHMRIHRKGKKGKSPWNKGKEVSEETRAKMSAAMKGKSPWNDGKKLGPRSAETRAKISAAKKGNSWHKGKHHSEETRVKMSAAMKGKSPWNKGMQWSEETRAKISAAMKGKKFSKEINK